MKTVRLKYLFLWTIFILSATAFAQNGRISGKVVDKKTGEELIGVSVQIQGTSIGAATDYEGKYAINNVNPGTYNLVVSYISYSKKVVNGVEVKSGDLASVNISLEESTKDLQEVVIQAEVKKESASALLVQQKNAMSVSSGVSADLIRKTPDRTTADVIKRISGASIQDNKFAIVRGLNDRYNMGYLNGAPLPSTESDRKAFSLDIIPASVIDNMQIVKGATPDLPGDFAGGIIQINTKDIPDENKITVNAGVQYNSITTFKSGLSGTKSGTDWLGFDNGTRQIPNGVISTGENRLATNDQKAEQTKLFNNNFQPNSVSSFRPNYSFQLAASKRTTLFKNDFGVVFALSYNNSFKYTPFTTSNPNVGSSETSVNSKTADGQFYDYDNYRNTVVAGGVLNFAYKIGKFNKFSFKNLITSTAEDQTIHQTGNIYSSQRQDQLKPDNYVYYYQSGQMLSSQFTGEHMLSASKIKIKYTGSMNKIHREVPDYRRIIYTSQYRKTNGDTAFSPYNVGLIPNASSYTPQGSGRYFSALNEQMYSAGYDITVPVNMPGFKKFDFKLGGYHQWRTRTFDARNYIYSQSDNDYDPSKGDAIKILGPGEVFANQNISSTTHFMTETTQGSDQYDASSQLNAGYIMADFKVLSRLRVNGGARLEAFNQKVSSINLGAQQKVDTTNIDILPSINLIYELTDKINIRASASKTLSRPEFREFAQVAFYEINYNAIITGNPNLVRSQIYNYDFKFEYYPQAGQLFSINPFYKKFIDPVETAANPGIAGTNSFSYLNAPEAKSVGIEFEGRLNFQSLGGMFARGVLKDLSVFANYALISSKVTLNDTSSLTSEVSKRPLQGQSPYVFNAGMMYSNREHAFDVTMAVNRIGRRIAFVNSSQNYLIWENPRTVLDLSISKTFFKKLQAKLTMGDILAQSLTYYQDLNRNGKFDQDSDAKTYSYKYGRTVQLSVGYTF